MKKIINYLKEKDTLTINILIVIIIILSIIGTIIYINNRRADIQNDHYKTISVKNPKDIEIEIPPGATLSEIANIIYKADIIKYPKKFISFAKSEGNSAKYQHGIFTLNINMSYEDISKKLQQPGGVPNSIKITIPEGYELRQIIDLYVQKGLGSKEGFENAIINGNYKYWFLEGLKKNPIYLEGYLFPATYSFLKDSTEETILKTMLDKFNTTFTNNMKIRCNELGMTVHEVLTLASIVEREAANDSERDIVASVFYNRLNSKTYPYLESCATVQYILKERKPVLSIADTQINSPYNTYKNAGLPPNPIASPGVESINATLYPANTDYLFFVLGNDGKHIFSKTYDQHQAAIAKIRGN
ncbi:MAG: endolytic transglycosylase MltG [Clostridia bacterium]|nr:endolytic transglycosylase MltG [Clostridia bacterium]MDD4375255.1 endolytic transglycosylase MltG [Clostridia bacterium]